MTCPVFSGHARREAKLDPFRYSPGHGVCLAIRSHLFREWAGTEEAFQQLIGELKVAGAHVPGKDKLGLTQQKQLPGAGRRRYIILRVSALERLRQAQSAVRSPA